MLQAGGLAGKHKEWVRNDDLFRKWAQGRTGFPFVDASMKELMHTGYMSNRRRQNFASFLTKVLLYLTSCSPTQQGHDLCARLVMLYKPLSAAQEDAVLLVSLLELEIQIDVHVQCICCD